MSTPDAALGTATVQDGQADTAPSNPYQKQARALAAAGDIEGLRNLGQRLSEMGYTAIGQTRQFIAATVQSLESSTT